MHIKRIHEMEEKLTEIALCEINKGIECVNTAEMGAVIDMIKDLACAEKDAREAKEMEKEEEDEKEEEKYMLRMLKEEYGMGEEDGKRFYDAWRYKNGRFAPKGRGTRRGYKEPPYYHMTPEQYREHDPEYWRDMDRHMGKMYYTEPITMGANRSTMSGMRDSREGRSGQSRRTYMETKEMHRSNTPEDKQQKMKELEKYMGELSGDIAEMISDASNEEKTMLKSKLQTLAQKIQ